jgi:membrane-associated protein
MRAPLALIEQIVDWIGPAFQVAGYVIIPVAVFLETSALIGVLVPGDVILALGGVYSARGELTLGWVLAMSIVAGIGGQSAGFWLGRRFGESLFRRAPLLNRLEGKLEDAKAFFDRHGGKAVSIGRFATGIAALIPFAAGMSKMPYRRFIMFAAPAVAVWATGIILVGYFLGANLERVDTVLARFGWGVLALIVVAVGGTLAWKRWRRVRERT